MKINLQTIRSRIELIKADNEVANKVWIMEQIRDLDVDLAEIEAELGRLLASGKWKYELSSDLIRNLLGER